MAEIGTPKMIQGKPAGAPRIHLRMMVYTVIEGIQGNFDTQDFAFEPHPFEASVAREYMMDHARRFIESQVERLDDLYRIIK